MKWLVIIIVLVVVIAVVVGLWLCTVRQGASELPPRSPHRLDDSVTPPSTLGLRPDAPSTAEGSVFGGGGTRSVPEEPGSDFAWEPEINEPEGPEPGADPAPPGARPEA